MASSTGDRSLGGILNRPVVLAFDGSADAKLAAIAAGDLAARGGLPVHIVYAVPVLPAPVRGAAFAAELAQELESDTDTLLDREVEMLRRRGVKVTQAHRAYGRPAEAVTRIATRTRAGLIIAGSRGLGGLRRLILGSVSEEIAHNAPSAVLIVRGGRRIWPPTRLVVGEDASEQSRRALDVAVDLAGALGVGITLTRALPPRLSPELDRTPGDVHRRRDAEQAARQDLKDLSAQIGSKLSQKPRIAIDFGDAAAVLATQAAPTDLIVVGSRGLGMIKRLALGSTSTKLLRGTRGPVLICP